MDRVLLDCGIDLHVANLVIIRLYFVLFIPALLLNTMAAWISWNLKTKSSFIVYLKNLVAADLLMTFLTPLRAADWIPGMPWGFRVNICQFGSVFFYLCMYVSIVLMEVISLDRFFKIVQPGGKLFGQSPLFGKVVTIKKKNQSSVFIILIVFLVCFAPFHITRWLFVERQVKNEMPWASLKVATDITLWLATTNVCLDPLIYFLLCKAFREKLYELKIFRNRF
ncbi:P2Y purinoceptor 13-like [Engraulis encrasicolus]|uniref:P2Y purinoceptor 13-like n=1 Tax=Engraulis encrasicolus TaxID=184585 RepID=UPI002FD0F3B2